MVSKGHHAKYKKHDAGYKDGWDRNHWHHNKGAYGHDVKHGGNRHNGYYKKAKADEYHDDWNKGWHSDDYHPKHNEHESSGYDWRFK